MPCNHYLLRFCITRAITNIPSYVPVLSDVCFFLTTSSRWLTAIYITSQNSILRSHCIWQDKFLSYSDECAEHVWQSFQTCYLVKLAVAGAIPVKYFKKIVTLKLATFKVSLEWASDHDIAECHLSKLHSMEHADGADPWGGMDGFLSPPTSSVQPVLQS